MSAGRSVLGLLNKRVHRIPPITVKHTLVIIQNYFYDPKKSPIVGLKAQPVTC